MTEKTKVVVKKDDSRAPSEELDSALKDIVPLLKQITDKINAFNHDTDRAVLLHIVYGVLLRQVALVGYMRAGVLHFLVREFDAFTDMMSKKNIMTQIEGKLRKLAEQQEEKIKENPYIS